MINKRLYNLSKQSKKYIWLSVLVKWISLITSIIIIFTIGRIVTSVFNDLTINFTFNIILILIAIVLRFISNYLEARFSYNASFHAKIVLRNKVYEKLFSLGITYANHIDSATVVQSAGEGIESLENYYGRYIPQIFYSLLAPITLFIFFSFISIRTASVMIVCVPLIPLAIIGFMKIAKRAMKKYWNNYTNLGNTFLENLQGLTTLKLFSADGVRHEKINEEAENFRQITMKVLSIQLNSITIMDIIAYGGVALGSIIALSQLNAGKIDIGQMVVIILLSAEFFIPLRLLGAYFHVATTGVAAANRIFLLLDIKEKQTTQDYTFEQIKSIVAKNLDFSYENNTQVLKHINFEINKNEFIAFVGESGSGKSTIANLLAKVRDVSDGMIFVDGYDINGIKSKNWVRHMNLITTNSYIFNASIKENLLMANPDAKKNQIDKVIIEAQLNDFIESLPNGLETMVGEGGSLLSGGQKQRLALARTLLSNREIIIFDEATSNVDCESEELIWQTIEKIRGEKTIIAISHRLANIKNADRIYMLKNGRIIESGSHIQLMTNKNEYYKMLKKQSELESVRREDGKNKAKI